MFFPEYSYYICLFLLTAKAHPSAAAVSSAALSSSATWSRLQPRHFEGSDCLYILRQVDMVKMFVLGNAPAAEPMSFSCRWTNEGDDAA